MILRNIWHFLNWKWINNSNDCILSRASIFLAVHIIYSANDKTDLYLRSSAFSQHIRKICTLYFLLSFQVWRLERIWSLLIIMNISQQPQELGMLSDVASVCNQPHLLELLCRRQIGLRGALSIMRINEKYRN